MLVCLRVIIVIVIIIIIISIHDCRQQHCFSSLKLLDVIETRKKSSIYLYQKVRKKGWTIFRYKRLVTLPHCMTTKIIKISDQALCYIIHIYGIYLILSPSQFGLIIITFFIRLPILIFVLL